MQGNSGTHDFCYRDRLCGYAIIKDMFLLGGKDENRNHDRGD